VMACSYAPERLRNDSKLLQQFPPCELPGLDDPSLCWNMYGRILEQTQQLVRFEEHLRRRGLSEDAKWMRGVIEQLMRVKLDERLRSFLDSQ